MVQIEQMADYWLSTVYSEIRSVVIMTLDCTTCVGHLECLKCLIVYKPSWD